MQGSIQQLDPSYEIITKAKFSKNSKRKHWSSYTLLSYLDSLLRNKWVNKKHCPPVAQLHGYPCCCLWRHITGDRRSKTERESEKTFFCLYPFESILVSIISWPWLCSVSALLWKWSFLQSTVIERWDLRPASAEVDFLKAFSVGFQHDYSYQGSLLPCTREIPPLGVRFKPEKMLKINWAAAYSKYVMFIIHWAL